MYQHILVPVDGSSTSSCALKEAVRLAREQKAQLRVVHVIDFRPMEYPDGFYPIPMMEEALRKQGAEILAQAEATAHQQELPIETALLETDGKTIPTMINEEARKWGADLIVLGTHGRHGLDRLLLGSVAERVARMATKPVLLVHGQEEVNQPAAAFS